MGHCVGPQLPLHTLRWVTTDLCVYSHIPLLGFLLPRSRLSDYVSSPMFPRAPVECGTICYLWLLSCSHCWSCGSLGSWWCISHRLHSGPPTVADHTHLAPPITQIITVISVLLFGDEQCTYIQGQSVGGTIQSKYRKPFPVLLATSLSHRDGRIC